MQLTKKDLVIVGLALLTFTKEIIVDWEKLAPFFLYLAKSNRFFLCLISLFLISFPVFLILFVIEVFRSVKQQQKTKEPPISKFGIVWRLATIEERRDLYPALYHTARKKELAPNPICPLKFTNLLLTKKGFQDNSLYCPTCNIEHSLIGGSTVMEALEMLCKYYDLSIY